MTFRLWIGAAAVAGIALAQPPDGFRGGGPRLDPVFTALDADGDGFISPDEIQKAPAALRKLDGNSDGKLTEDELRPAGGPRGRGGPGTPGEGPPTRPEELSDTLMGFDRNGDGKLTRAEVPERMQNLFERADADQDGVLTREELQKAAAGQQAPGAGRGGPAGGRGRGGPLGGMMRFNPILAAVDTDHDGTISSDEIAGAAGALKELDQDGDGKLTRQEVRPNMGERERR